MTSATWPTLRADEVLCPHIIKNSNVDLAFSNTIFSWTEQLSDASGGMYLLKIFD